MKILVTGGAGYLGSVIVPELLKAGHEVTVVDSLMYQQPSLLDCCHWQSLKIVRGDARDEKLIAREIKDVDYILPLSCLTGAPLCAKDPVAAQTTNLDAIKLILRLRTSQQRIVFPTTNSGYGIGEKNRFCDEQTPLRPISLYGRLKVDAEQAILKDGNCITFRLATVFGISPRMRVDLLVNDFTYRAVTDKFVVLFEAHFKRNYIHIRDVARAFLFGMEHFESMKNNAYNVGLDDANLSKWELCEEIKKIIPDFTFLESPVGEDPDKRDYIVSNAKIKAAGFVPQVSLQQGIEELIKGYQILRRNQYSNV